MEGKFGVQDGYIHRFSGLTFLSIAQLELHSVERNYLLGDNLTLVSRVPTDRKSLSSCVSRVEEVNEVTALAQCRALWPAENEALSQRKAL